MTAKNMENFVALRIRLARGGAKKRPFYRVIVTDSRNARDGKFLEKLGFYNPLVDLGNAERVVVDAERVKYWMSVGATASKRVEILLSSVGFCDRPAVIESPKKSAPKKKAQERLAALQAANA